MGSKSKKKEKYVVKDSLLSIFVQKQYNKGVVATTSYDFRAKVFGDELEAKAFIDKNHLDGYVIVKK